MSFTKRLAHVRAVLYMDSYFKKHGTDAHQEAYWIKQELGFDRSRGIRVIAPNERGLLLLARVRDLQFYVCLAAYLFTGMFEERFD